MPVSPEKDAALRARMAALGIRESDLDESFVRSSGPGGQHTNKTSTCVQLVHRPTGIAVKCQEDRSQAVNRYRARRMLADRVESQIAGRKSAEQQAREKIRRQKRRRSRRAKNKMLADKHHRSGILASRTISHDWSD